MIPNRLAAWEGGAAANNRVGCFKMATLGNGSSNGISAKQFDSPDKPESMGWEV